MSLPEVVSPERWRAVESAQFASWVFSQTLNDAGVLGSIGSVGDAYVGVAPHAQLRGRRSLVVGSRRMSSNSLPHPRA